MAIRVLSTFAFVIGIMFCRLTPGLQLGLLSFLGISLLAKPQARKGRAWLWLAVALVLGLARSSYDHRFSPDVLQAFEGDRPRFSGIVLDSPRQWGAAIVCFFKVTAVNGASLKYPAIVLVRYKDAQDSLAPMERWEFCGRYAKGRQGEYPAGFSQRFWLWTQRAEGVLEVGKFDEVSYLGPPLGASPRALAARLRAVMQQRFLAIEDPIERALVGGVVFGDTQALPPSTQELFRRTGTSHLLAASGMNVALLVGFITLVARWLGFGAWRVTFIAIPAVVGYAFLAGCAPSITRAAVSAVVAMIAISWGRKSSPWNSLCLSILILLFWEPRQLYDLGFQLSVLAVIGLIAGPRLDKNAPMWKSSLLMTVSASLATLPIVWLNFHQLSLTLLPANLMLGPVVELLFPLGLLLALLPFSPLCFIVSLIAKLSLYLVGLISGLADPITLARPGIFPLLLLATGLFLWSGLFEYFGVAKLKRRLAVVLAGLALLLGQWQGLRPLAQPDQLIIRRVASETTYYWLSSYQGEVLILSDSWQETRARGLLLDLGCSREPQLIINKSLEVRWGGFDWKQIEPFLPKARFIEVRTKGCDYTVSSWRPANEG